MRVQSSKLGIIVRIALRNLFASGVKTIVIGGITAFGALIVVIGSTLLQSVDLAMEHGIVDSVAGHLQIYSADSRDELDVLGGATIEGSDVAAIDDFARLRELVDTVPGVKALVPMGIGGVVLSAGNTIDWTLAELRRSVQRLAAGEGDRELARDYALQKQHVRTIISVLQGGSQSASAADQGGLNAEDASVLARVSAESFWQTFDEQPFDALEFLENRAAPLANDADLLGIRYLGTDPTAFAAAFERFTIVEGQNIPRGKPGFLFSKFFYESELKLKNARNLDKIKLAREQRGVRIREDAELQRLTRENGDQTKELLLQLDERKLALFRDKLRHLLGTSEQDVGKLLAAFFATDDQNFDARYAFFYRELAPSLQLYRMPIGSVLTLKGVGKNGYVRSLSLPVYGTYSFRGLETSPQAGALNIMDLASFRELYGVPTRAASEELAALHTEAGVREVGRDTIEAELFGTTSEPTNGAQRDDGYDFDRALHELVGGRTRAREDSTQYDPKELERGVFLNAAVVLDDPSTLDAMQQKLSAAIKAASLPLRVVSWKVASGLTGQLVLLLRCMLYAAVFVIFSVALVILANTVVLATLERVRELGTLRAIGAQRRFLLVMLLVESLLIGLLFGGLGAALGVSLLTSVRAGIPAVGDVMHFFFAGDRLYPDVQVANVALGLSVACAVSVLAGLFPAAIALRVTPRLAMQSEE